MSSANALNMDHSKIRRLVKGLTRRKIFRTDTFESIGRREIKLFFFSKTEPFIERIEDRALWEK